MGKTFVVLGGGHGGIHISHYLLSIVTQFPDLKVILVSPTDELFWNLASVRVVIPDVIPVNSTFFSIPKAFAKYPAKNFEFVHGKAESLEAAANSVTVLTNNGETKIVSYHTLIITTGSRAREGLPWKSLETTEKTKEAISALRTKISAASSIVVGGAGPTGVEFAAELGAMCGKNKSITLISPGKLPLDGLTDSARSTAQKELTKLGIMVKNHTKVTKTTVRGGHMVLELTERNGYKTTLNADEFVPTYGVVFNTEFAPAHWKDDDDRLKVNATLRQPQFPNIFIVGDAANVQAPLANKLVDQLAYMKKQLVPYLNGETLSDYVKNDSIGIAVALGPSRGTGQVGRWKLFSLLVWWAKSRTLGLDGASKAVDGLNL